MMRLKMIAVGLLIGGGIALAAAGSLAMQPTPPQQPPPATAPPPPQPRSYIVRFPGGTTFELVGISIYPSKPDSWRTPDGLPLAKAPYHRAGYRVFAGDNDQVWEVAFRKLQVGKDGLFKLQTGLPSDLQSTHGSLVSLGLDTMRLPIPEMYSTSLIFSKDQTSCVLRCGLATGSWKTKVTSDGLDLRGSGVASPGVVMGTAGQTQDKTIITVSQEHSADDSRVVAADLKGIEHEPSRHQVCGVGRFTQTELEYSLPLAEIKEFRFQTRAYEWATVDDVVLKPRKDQDAPIEPDKKQGVD